MIPVEKVYTALNIVFCGEQLELHPLKAIYWEKENTLILSDLHLGKAKHFVKAGIALPAAAIMKKNMARLYALTNQYQPKSVLFLGDLFHSDFNETWDVFCDYTNAHADIEFILVEGNHDFLDKRKYEEAKLKVWGTYQRGPFSFSHYPTEVEGEYYNLCGHLHPGVRMIGVGKQGQRFPCYYFGKYEGILPAFGAFTGLMNMTVKSSDQVFIIAEDEVFKV